MKLLPLKEKITRTRVARNNLATSGFYFLTNAVASFCVTNFNSVTWLQNFGRVCRSDKLCSGLLFVKILTAKIVSDPKLRALYTVSNHNNFGLVRFQRFRVQSKLVSFHQNSLADAAILTGSRMLAVMLPPTAAPIGTSLTSEQFGVRESLKQKTYVTSHDVGQMTSSVIAAEAEGAVPLSWPDTDSRLPVAASQSEHCRQRDGRSSVDFRRCTYTRPSTSVGATAPLSSAIVTSSEHHRRRWSFWRSAKN